MNELSAYAKLTTSLHVTGLRDDGYHLLVAEMVTVDLFDTLIVDPTREGLEIQTERASRAELLVQSDNLITRALELCGRRAFVSVIKRIPVGGGLGGGSADAAAIFTWADMRDLDVAASLGSDVPFCMSGGRARVSGVGEVIEPLEFFEATYTLIIPPFSISTPAVYRRYDELVAKGTPPARGHARNHLTTAAESVEPRLEVFCDGLEAHTGARPILAGSGSTVFYEGAAMSLGLSAKGTINVGDMVAEVIEVHAVDSRTWP